MEINGIEYTDEQLINIGRLAIEAAAAALKFKELQFVPIQNCELKSAYINSLKNNEKLKSEIEELKNELFLAQNDLRLLLKNK